MHEALYFVVLAVLMLYHCYHHGRDAFPFVTLLVVALCTIAALRVLPLEHGDVCVTADTSSWFRIIFNNFFFGDITHWFGCMVGWLMCAPALEQEHGSAMLFAILCAAIVVDSNMYSCITLVRFPWPLWLARRECKVGLSGIIFCFETLLARSGTAQPREVLGMVCKRSLVLVFIDLITIQLMSEKVSFHGHLSGILTGLVIYCFLPYADRAIQSNVQMDKWAPRVERLNSWMKQFRGRLFWLCIILLLLGSALGAINYVADSLLASLSSLFGSSSSSSSSSSCVLINTFTFTPSHLQK